MPAALVIMAGATGEQGHGQDRAQCSEDETSGHGKASLRFRIYLGL
jgi:hypothetical protein